MKKDIKLKVLLVLSIAGLLFSGYLSGVKFFTDTCVLNEPCPYFLGYPACYFGFAMFLTLAILGSLLFTNKIKHKNGLADMGIMSLLGVFFAGYFTLREIPILFERGLSAYVLGLPTCALGLLFYITICILSFYSLLKKKI